MDQVQDFDCLLPLEGSDDILFWTEPLFFDVVIDLPVAPSENGEVEQSSDSKVSGLDGSKGQHYCPHCPKSFSFRSRLERHLTTHQVSQNQLSGAHYV